MSGYLRHDHLFFKFIVCIILAVCPSSGYAAHVTASWTAPAANADGSPLTDLAGYKVYYGLASGNYTGTIDAGNVTTCRIDNLVEGLTYYFAVTAYDTSGNESTYSEEQSFTLPPPPPPSAPDIAVSDSISPSGDLQMPFGSVTEGVTSEQTVTVTNSGNAGLIIGAIAGSIPLSPPFSILNDYCSGATIAPSSSCTFGVRFAPSAVGTYNQTFDIPSSDADEDPVILSVSGTGLSSNSNNPPSGPEPVYPTHGQKGLGQKVGFKWKKSSDPDGNTITYDLYICEDISFTTGCMTQYNIASFSNEEIMYAGVGAAGSGILLMEFLAGMIYGMRRKGKLVLITLIVLTAILFMSCGGGGAGGGSSALLSNSDGPPDDAFTGIIQEVSGLSEGTTYYWKVVANDGKGGQASSTVQSFETQ